MRPCVHASMRACVHACMRACGRRATEQAEGTQAQGGAQAYDNRHMMMRRHMPHAQACVHVSCAWAESCVGACVGMHRLRMCVGVCMAICRCSARAPYVRGVHQAGRAGGGRDGGGASPAAWVHAMEMESWHVYMDMWAVGHVRARTCTCIRARVWLPAPPQVRRGCTVFCLTDDT